MAGRSPARFLAPIALIACAFALYSVVNRDEEPTSTTPVNQTATPTPKASDDKKKSSKKKAKTYTVKSGDTVSAIAEKMDVDIDTLMELNPELDGSTIAPGDKIRLEK